MIKRKKKPVKKQPFVQTKWPELHMQLKQELEDTSARHAAGNRVIEQLRREVASLSDRVVAAEKHADHIFKSFEATLDMVRRSR